MNRHHVTWCPRARSCPEGRQVAGRPGLKFKARPRWSPSWSRLSQPGTRARVQPRDSLNEPLTPALSKPWRGPSCRWGDQPSAPCGVTPTSRSCPQYCGRLRRTSQTTIHARMHARMQGNLSRPTSKSLREATAHLGSLEDSPSAPVVDRLCSNIQAIDVELQCSSKSIAWICVQGCGEDNSVSSTRSSELATSAHEHSQCAERRPYEATYVRGLELARQVGDDFNCYRSPLPKTAMSASSASYPGRLVVRCDQHPPQPQAPRTHHSCVNHDGAFKCERGRRGVRTQPLHNRFSPAGPAVALQRRPPPSP